LQKKAGTVSREYWESYFKAIKQLDWEQARALLERISGAEPGNPQVALKLGDINQRMGNTADAIAAYHESARLLRKLGFIQKALALYKIILRLDSFNQEAVKSSRELMIEIEGKRVNRKTSTPDFAPQREEQQPEHEAGIPLRPEDMAQQADEEPAVLSVSQESQPLEHTDQETIYIPSLFSSIPPDEIVHLLQKSIPDEFAAGRVIIEEGDSGDSIFLITAGRASVVAHILGEEIELSILSPGDFFGEVAFLTGRPRTASVTAVDRVVVREFNKLLLEDIFENYPEVIQKLHDFYYSRVQDTLVKMKTRKKKQGTA
jgi:CRP-like cAMP-binding protein